MAEDIRGARCPRRSPSAHDDRLLGGQGASFGERGEKKGAQNQAIGRSRGGRTPKIPARVDAEGRPHALPLTGGHAAAIKGAASLLAATAPREQLIGDQGYAADHLRLFRQTRGTPPVIPNKINRKKLFPFAADLSRLRNVVARTSCRPKDFRAIATRDDQTARNFLAGLCLVTALCSWLT